MQQNYIPVIRRLVFTNQGEGELENLRVRISFEPEFAHVFEAFYRVEQSRNRQTGGSGLGLYIVKMILDQHGASYRMGNTCDGVRFSFSL